jgi:hypothetical protein
MKTFTDQEMRLIRRVEGLAPLSILELKESCPRHSACMPLPLFVVQKTTDEAFDAVWNDHHSTGPRQHFRFADVIGVGGLGGVGGVGQAS